MKPPLIKNVLLVYKKNPYWNHFLRWQKQPLLKRGAEFIHRDLGRIHAAHQAHVRTLREVERILREKGVRYKAVYRARSCDYSPYDFIVAVGGDGTFLEAARQARSQPILGVNSDPVRSVGSFCAADRKGFKRILDQILSGCVRTERLHRLQLRLNGKPLGVNVLNDLLITDRRPAAMSRYWIQVGGVQEEQRSSGLWIATAAGSTGAIKSAGGRILPRTSKAIQYKPRELYAGYSARYRLTGGIGPSHGSLLVGSLMREGLICVDGEHLKLPFRYGDLLEISRSPYPLCLIRQMEISAGRGRGWR